MEINEALFKKYIAIKVKGFDYYLWFDKEYVIVEDSIFTGSNGWGKDRISTSIECRLSEIISIMYSPAIQYS